MRTIAAYDQKTYIQSYIYSNTVLLFPTIKLAIFTSGKSGSTSVRNWYLAHHNLSHLQIDPKIRNNSGTFELVNALQNSHSMQESFKEFRHALLQPKKDGWTTVKFVRDPIKRLVSGFFMIMRLAPSGTELSFREFVDLPDSYFHYTGDGHVWPQITPHEKNGLVVMDRIYRLEDGLEKALRDLEMRFGLPNKVGEVLTHANRRAENTFHQEPGSHTDVTYSSDNIRDGITFPSIEAFYDDELLQRAYYLYEDDCKTYGYTYAVDKAAYAANKDRKNWPMNQRMKKFANDGFFIERYEQYFEEIGKEDALVIYGLSLVVFDLLFRYGLVNKRIVAIVDNSPEMRKKWSLFFQHNLSIPLIRADELHDYAFDRIFVGVQYKFDEIKLSLTHDGIPSEKIVRMPEMSNYWYKDISDTV